MLHDVDRNPSAVARDLHRQNAANERKECGRRLVGMPSQVIDAASLIERGKDHRLNVSRQLVGNASWSTLA